LKRFGRKTLGYSKDLETHKLAVALHFGVYNFVRNHHSLGTTPSVAAGLEEKAWSLEKVVEMTADYMAAKRGREELITVLAAEALSGFLSLRVSVTHAALLTVIRLPWALLSFRGSAGFAWITLAMLAMLWRGEAWKTVFLQSEQQVLELQQQQRPPIESNAISFEKGQRILYDDARRVACPQSLVEE